MYVYDFILGPVFGRTAVRHTKTSSNILKGRKCAEFFYKTYWFFTDKYCEYTGWRKNFTGRCDMLPLLSSDFCATRFILGFLNYFGLIYRPVPPNIKAEWKIFLFLIW
jgi:hypothetical protein